ncbi:MAG TPA: iron-containing alcohol dehydrogenase, partial [Deltaproteobacteria bacterium]|nr:iron-containing alcohol dehydrogenase [Deltaproteobacteria bacterium]
MKMDRITLFRTTPRIVMGPGTLNQIAEEVRQLKAKRVLFVSDKGIIKAGLLKTAQKALESAHIDYAVFDGVEPDPRYEIVAECAKMVEQEKADLLIGLGGGSPIDIAKASAIMATNDGSVADYFGIDLVPNRGLPTIIVPT